MKTKNKQTGFTPIQQSFIPTEQSFNPVQQNSFTLTEQSSTPIQQNGFTLIEIVVSIGIFAILLVGIISAYNLMARGVRAFREQATIAALADQYLETARNLPYSQIGTTSGNPHGNLPDQTDPATNSINGVNYQIYYDIAYIDDPADDATDTYPNDYKQVKVYVKNENTDALESFITTIAPQGEESLASGGELQISVINAVGQPVAGASVQITNTSISPSINVTRTTDANGNWDEAGLPDSVNGYHIVVTKSGYSIDQTYPITPQNPNPVKPDATISNGQITQVSFAIDLLSNLTIETLNQKCSAISGVGTNVQGAKLIGTNPNIPKFDNTFTSDSSGSINMNGIEWDTYTPTLTDPAYMIYGSSPIQQISLLPNTSALFTLILGPATANSLLVIVKDAGGNPVEGANVDLQTITPASDTNQTTGGSVWLQNDWSGGFGQADWSSPSMYYQDSGTVNTATAGQVALSQASGGGGGTYSSSGWLESSSFDTGSSRTSYTTLDWQPTSQNPSTSISFQIATNNDDKTWNFLGPNGTTGSFYTVPGTTISSANNGNRYVRYKVYFSTNDTSKTPVLTSVGINYVSGCFTPGQTIFPGLTAGSNYNVIVSATGYTTQTFNNVDINGYNVLDVTLQ